MTDTTINPPAASIDAKWWAQSLTIRGAMLSAGCAALPALGTLIGLDLSAAAIGQVAQQATVAAQAIGGVAGAAMTVLGRLRATQRLARRPMQLMV